MAVATLDVIQQLETKLRAASPEDSSLAQVSLHTARTVAGLFAECVGLLNRLGGITAETESQVEAAVLARCSAALASLVAGDPTAAARSLLQEWAAVTGPLARAPSSEHAAALRDELANALRPGSADPRLAELDWLAAYGIALVERLSSELSQQRPRATLRLLMSFLELSQDDLGRMFGVSGETVRRWENGTVCVPPRRRAAILAADDALSRLLEIFRIDRLAGTLRRGAEVFGGESALDWILRGRIGEVAERYEAALLYQA